MTKKLAGVVPWTHPTFVGLILLTYKHGIYLLLVFYFHKNLYFLTTIRFYFSIQLFFAIHWFNIKSVFIKLPTLSHGLLYAFNNFTSLVKKIICLILSKNLAYLLIFGCFIYHLLILSLYLQPLKYLKTFLTYKILFSISIFSISTLSISTGCLEF